MALGDFQLFQWKSKSTQKTEQEQYEKWAFPYGQQQRDNLEALLKVVCPKESGSMALVPFLTCKELYEGVLKKTGTRELAVDTLLNTQKKYKGIIRKKEMSTYLALVIADANVDESCRYPTADEIREQIRELDDMRKDG